MFKRPVLRFLIMFTLTIAVLSAAINIVPAGKGYYYTDSLYSKIYFTDGRDAEDILTGPGFGYFVLSPDETMIGFKYREKPGGKEAAAIYDIGSKKIRLLHEPVYRAGQPSFTDMGSIAYTINNELHIIAGQDEQTYDLGVYASNAPISPDGSSVIYNDNEDRLLMMDLKNNNVSYISDASTGCVYPQWSNDSRYVSYYTFHGDIMIYDRIEDRSIDVGKGGHFKWSPVADQYSYVKVEFEQDMEIKNTDIVEADIDKKIILSTATANIKEHGQFYDLSGSLKYVDENMSVNDLSEHSLNKSTGQPLTFPTHPVRFEQEAPAADSYLDVPYIHQVYDTPGSRGYSSCAPTTAAMVLAYYGLLPKWPFLSGFDHWNDYAAYVHERYYFHDTYFNLTYNDCNSSGSYCYTCYGGMGYMWTNGSPNSRMAGYYSKHGVSAQQTWNTNWTTVMNEIDKKQPFSICNFLSGSGHLIVAKGRADNDQRTVITNDPYGNKNTTGYPSYDGETSLYDWPGYNHGHVSLNDAYVSYGSQMPWCIATSYTAPVPVDSIVDDTQFNDGFYIKAHGNDVPMRYYRSAGSGFGDHHWWTYSEESSKDICYVTWTPQVEDAYYELYAYIPANANATSAQYRIRHAAGEARVSIDQSLYPDAWVFLGKYMMVNDGSNYVYLGDSTGVSGEIIAFDAMKWVPATQEELDFTSDHQNGYIGYKVNCSVVSDFTAGDYTYIWDFGDGETAVGDSVWHIYDAVGDYSITLQAMAGSIVVSEEKTDYISIHPNVFTGNELELIYPDSLSSIDTKIPVFTWRSTAETYTLNISNTPEFDSLIVDDTTNNNWFELSEELTENKTYYWQLSTVGGNSSRIWAFHVNTMNSLPGSFDLISPEADFVSDTLRPEFSWTKAVDKDPGDEYLIYRLFIGTGENNMECYYEGSETSYRLSRDLNENERYTWYVQAVDQTQAFSRSESLRNIGINTFNEAPPAPVLVAPNHNSYQTTRYPHLEWTAVQDPDPGDEIHYEVFYWYTGNDNVYAINTSETYHDERRFKDQSEYFWTVAAVDLAGEYAYSDTQVIYFDTELDVVDIPADYELYGNYPNPFNPITSISFGLPVSEEITLNIYDLSGKLISEVIKGYYPAGKHIVAFNGADIPSGMYIYKLQAGEFIASSKMLLLK